jgi:DNA-binding NarL/FixJ family response regulator
MVICDAIRSVVEKHAGWSVCGIARDGAEAVRLAGELRPDFVLLDLAMPVMDGFHAAREISRCHPAACLVMITQHYSTSLRMEAMKCGIREVVGKSDVVEYLVRTMSELTAADPFRSRGTSAGSSQNP